MISRLNRPQAKNKPPERKLAGGLFRSSKSGTSADQTILDLAITPSDLVQDVAALVQDVAAVRHRRDDNQSTDCSGGFAPPTM
jgi:hypothetical protein